VILSVVDITDGKEDTMHTSLKRKLLAGLVVVVALAGGGAAIAATQLGSSPSETSQAIVDDAAQQLGVQPGALSNALKKALENQIDAAVAAGRLTKAEADELKSRIESGELPLFGLGPHGHGHFRGLDAAATYLGLTTTELRSQLGSGNSLAQIAEAQGKSVDGLVQALVEDATSKLDAAVAAGRLTKEREQAILSDLKQHITDLVNRTRHADDDHGPPGPGF
jgi:polyhydroxyalkanoate synthesis regulator phasin